MNWMVHTDCDHNGHSMMRSLGKNLNLFDVTVDLAYSTPQLNFTFLITRYSAWLNFAHPKFSVAHFTI